MSKKGSVPFSGYVLGDPLNSIDPNGRQSALAKAIMEAFKNIGKASSPALTSVGDYEVGGKIVGSAIGGFCGAYVGARAGPLGVAVGGLVGGVVGSKLGAEAGKALDEKLSTENSLQ